MNKVPRGSKGSYLDRWDPNKHHLHEGAPFYRRAPCVALPLRLKSQTTVVTLVKAVQSPLNCPYTKAENIRNSALPASVFDPGV